jgi:hypothetical protein
MKTNILLFINLIFLSCNGQIDNPKKTAMQKFDINKYEENLKKDNGYEGYNKSNTVYVKQYHSIKEGYVEESYTKNLVENYIEENQYSNGFKDVMLYDKAGILTSLKKYFRDNVEIGIWQTYDASGSLIEEINKDEHYTFSIDDVLLFGKKNNVDFAKTGKVWREYSNEYKKYIWLLDWNTGKAGKAIDESIFRTVILDATNGISISDKTKSIQPVIRN